MSVNYALHLFLADGRPDYPLLAAWRARGPVVPLQATAVLLENDLSANEVFRGVWRRAFPARKALPLEPLAEKDGRGTDAFWTVLG